MIAAEYIDNHQKPSDGIQADRHEPLFTVHILILFCECIGIEKDPSASENRIPCFRRFALAFAASQTILIYV